MGKWVLGLLGSIITGAILWVLTTIFFPKIFGSVVPKPTPTPLAQKIVRVECSANPPTVAPGSTTEISVRVTRGGEPVEGAAVSVVIPSTGRLASGNTYSGGTFRVPWTAPQNSAASYVFPANAVLDGVRTSEEVLSGHYGTTCQIFVRR